MEKKLEKGGQIGKDAVFNKLCTYKQRRLLPPYCISLLKKLSIVLCLI